MPSIIWAFFILIVCSISIPKVNELPSFIPYDKIAHFILYFVLFILLIFGFNKYTESKFIFKYKYLLGSVFSLFYGLFIELFQKYIIINRHFDLFDLLANFIGILFGLFLYIKILKNKVLVSKYF